MFFVRLISLWWILACVGGVANAQRVTTLPEDNRPILTVFLGPDAESLNFENALLKWDGLPSILSQVAFHKMTSSDPIYQERWGQVVPSSRFPAVMLQDTDGGVVYLASGQDLDEPDDMVFQMKRLWSAYSKAKRDAKTQIPTNQAPWDTSSPDCPDGSCPPNAQPNERIVIPALFDTIAKRPTPIIDTLTGAIWAVVLAIIGAGMLLLLFSVLIVVLLALTRKK